MLILAIETSCDDTAASVLEIKGTKKNPRFNILANVVSSQNEIHAPFGGIVPNLACRAHEENINPVIYSAIKKAQEKLSLTNKNFIKKLDFLTVTAGPGLAPSLRVGVNATQSLGFSWKKKIVGVNHLVAHIYANFLKNPDIQFPALALVVSGGHTQLVLMKKHLDFKIIGHTRDDAAGETFDKTARLMELGYPGGPVIAQRAKLGDPNIYNLPRPMINSADFDFSFSGLKTAVLYLIKSLGTLSEQQINDLCASTQQAIVDVLVAKTIRAAKKYKVKSILLGGGVAANDVLVEKLGQAVEKLSGIEELEELKKGSKTKVKKSLIKKSGVKFYYPDKSLCMDNAQMISVAGYYCQKKAAPWNKIKMDSNLKM